MLVFQKKSEGEIDGAQLQLLPQRLHPCKILFQVSNVFCNIIFCNLREIFVSRLCGIVSAQHPIGVLIMLFSIYAAC